MRNTKDTGGPAFPNPHYVNQKGMSLRDYFASQAMIALIADTRNFGSRDIASAAYDMADFMLKEREQNDQD